jgi:RNA polymerase sigma-70 factor (ECF subfamily)
MLGPTEDEELRSLLKSHPAKAAELLFRKHSGNLEALARSFTHDSEAARDIVHDAILNLMENAVILSKNHETSLLYYLVRVVKFKAITHFKNSVRLTAIDETFLNFPSHDGDVERTFFHEDLRRELRRLLLEFPPKEKECMLMKFDRNMTNEQIAAELGITVKAVERSVTSARKRLRKHADR